jgi:hypothetical protein
MHASCTYVKRRTSSLVYLVRTWMARPLLLLASQLLVAIREQKIKGGTISSPPSSCFFRTKRWMVHAVEYLRNERAGMTSSGRAS